MHLRGDLARALASSGAEILLGPRTGARDGDFRIPLPLPPALPDWDLTVSRVESLRPDMPEPLRGGGAVTGYREHLEGQGTPILLHEDGSPVALRHGRVTYMGGWGDATALDRIVTRLTADAGIETLDLPEGIRVRDTGTERFWFNHTDRPITTKAGEIQAAGVLRVPRLR
jgi:beta-galactosidase